MYKSLSRRSVPLIWVIATTIGITEQSSRNCIITCSLPSLLLINTELMITDSRSSSSAIFAHKQRSLERVWLKAWQWRSKCSKEPSASGRQLGRRHFPDLFWVQCLCSLSVKYLPDSILQVITDLWHSNGFEPQAVQIGWGLVRDMKKGLKYGADVREDALARNLISQ